MNLHGRLNRCIDDTLSQDPRAALIAYRQLADEYMPWLEARVVALAKREQWTYGRMSRLLGCSRQHLQRKFRVIVPELPFDPDLAYQRSEREARRWINPAGGLRLRPPDDDHDPIAW